MLTTAVWIVEHQVDLFAALGTGGMTGAIGAIGAIGAGIISSAVIRASKAAVSARTGGAGGKDIGGEVSGPRARTGLPIAKPSISRTRSSRRRSCLSAGHG